MNRHEIVNEIEHLLKDEMELEVECLAETTDLSVCGVDSLSIVIVLDCLEKKFNIQLHPDEIDGFFVGNLVEVISSKLA